MMRSMYNYYSQSVPGCCNTPPGWFFYPVVCVPVYCEPPAPEYCEEKCEVLTVPQRIDATGDIKSTSLVGGHDKAHLTLEYLVEKDAVAPKVTVTAVQPDGATSTWTDSSITAGFHVQEKFLNANPGTKVTLEVSSVIASLRWCETICC